MPFIITPGGSTSPTASITPTEPVGLPQFDAPFRLDTRGKPVVVEQDDPEEIGAAIYNILICPQGAKLNDPDFGIPSPLFGPVPPDTGDIASAVRAYEPRATDVQVAQTVEQITRAVDLDVTVSVPDGTGTGTDS